MTTTSPKRQPVPFGKYLLLDRINIGGMAEVWRAKSFGAGGFEKIVAIKRILPNIAEDEEFIAMFIDEAKISAQLTHANVAHIDDLGQINGSYYIAMEYIAGKDMRAIFDRCRKKGEPAPVPLTCYAVSKLCEGLDYAHRKKDTKGVDLNIVHRDVSPQNVLISYEGEVKVIDFGIAKAAGKATKTQAGILKGKFGYMSPEQIRGLPLDRRSDVFAIGVCLYEMLTGERLFVGDSDFSVLEKVRKAEVLPPSTYNKKIPEQLEKIVLKALAKDVDERYQYANELSDDLQRFLITSDSIFSRKDLMAYMKATFAEEVEKEKSRLQEYSDVKAPEGMLAAAELGYGAASPATTPATGPGVVAGAKPGARPTLSSPSIPQARPPGGGVTTGVPQLKPTLSSPNIPQVKAPSPVGASAPLPEIKRTPSLTALPKLTAAAPVSTAHEESGATVLIDGAALNLHGGDPLANPEPTAIGPAPTEAAPSVRPVAAGRPRFDLTPEVPTAVNHGAGLPSKPKATAPEEGDDTPDPDVTPDPDDEAGDRSAEHRREVIPAALAGNETRIGTAPEELEAPPTEDPNPRAKPPPRRPAPSRKQASAGLPFAGGDRTKLLGIGAGALVAIVLIVALLWPRPPALGLLTIDAPGFTGTATLNVNGEKTPNVSFPDTVKVPVGPAVVLITADGYEPFREQLTISGSPASLTATMKKTVQPTRLVVVPEPLQAEVRVDGAVMKAEGQAGVYLGELERQGEYQIEVRLAGYQPFRQRVDAKGEPLQVSAKLSPMEFPLSVFSSPEGATITVDGRDFGKTPSSIRVYPTAKTITFTMKCHQPRVVTINLPSSPSQEPVPVRANLKRIRGCR